MPSISTTLYPRNAYVRVEVNWADISPATSVKVERIDCATGTRTALRPYVSYDGDYLTLSCGFGLFWDTEAPLDTCFYYCTTAQDAFGNTITTASDPLFMESFARTNTDTWNTATSGQTYTYTGPLANFDVTPAKGLMTVTATPQVLRAVVSGLSVGDGVLRGTYTHPVLPTGAAHEVGIQGRYVDANNFVDMRMFINTANTITVAVRQVVAGVESNVVFSPAVPFATATTSVNFVFTYWGSTLSAKVWPATLAEPAAVNATTTVSFYRPGSLAMYVSVPGGSTNVTPYTATWGPLTLTDPCNTTQPVQTCTANMTLPSDGEFRYGDPVRPCNDVILKLSDTANPDCVPTQGIFFGNMEDETFAANSGSFVPVNADTPIGVNRTRMKAASTLTVASRTFADRNALRQLHAPGSETQLRTPAVYGVTDRYMLAGDVTEHRPMSDHKIQPRAVVIPHTIMARPWGPSQGVCGTRVQDLCDKYATLAALEASGLSWADVLRGSASPDSPTPSPTPRTWNDVNSQYASWNAVQAGNSNWADLLDGA